MADIYVNAGESIQAAIDAASSGDTIIVGAGTYDETVTINKSVHVLGANSEVAGTGARSAESIVTKFVVTTPNTVEIDGFRIEHDSGDGPNYRGVEVVGTTANLTIENNVFFSNEAGGGTGARAILLPVIASGHVTIEDNLITGSSTTGKFSSAAWDRGIWTDGGGLELDVVDNTFVSTRTGINLDGALAAGSSVSDNTFDTAGSGMSFGPGAALSVVSENHFRNVDTDFNLQNIPAGVSFDAEAAVATVTPTGNPGTDAVLVLGGPGSDSLAGASLVDLLVGQGANDTLNGRGANDVLDGGNGLDTAVYSTDVADGGFVPLADADPATAGNQAGWQVSGGADGVDTLRGVEIVDDATGPRVLLVGSGGFASIQAAIDAANPGDTILIAPGTYHESASTIRGSGGIYIDKPNLTLQGVKADGSLITSAEDARTFGAVVIADHQLNFGANHFIDTGGTGTVIRGLHLQAGLETDNKLVEFWADDVTLQDNFIDTLNTGAAAIYINEITSGPDETPINTYTITENILNEGIYVGNGVGTPGGGISPTQVISDNNFEGTFDTTTGSGRYDMVAVQGRLPGIGWQPDSAQVPTITDNTHDNNNSPFIFRMSEADTSLFPTPAQIATIVADNTAADSTYAYVLTDTGALRFNERDTGGGPADPTHVYAVANSIHTFNLGLDSTPDAVFGGERVFVQEGDRIFVQSGATGSVNDQILVDNLTVTANANSADLNLTLGSTYLDATDIADAHEVISLTLGDYGLGLGANVDVTGNEEGNEITGNSGNNALAGGLGNDDLFGKDGNDTIAGGDGNDRLVGDRGDDLIDGGTGTDRAQFFGDWNDYVFEERLDGSIQVADLRSSARTGTDIVRNVEFFDFADISVDFTAVQNRAGGADPDTQVGDAAGNTFSGLGGDDTILGFGGNDDLSGGAGDDQVFGGIGDDRLDGGDGDDRMGGEAGNDTMNGGFRNDLMSGGAGNDTMNGDAGNDRMSGDTGDDLMFGGAGLDFVDGGVGNDRLFGLDGNDELRGGVGNDTLDGGAGNDFLTGGAGRDTLIGGVGADRFDFNALSESVVGANRDVVHFERRQGDKIDLSTIDADTDGTRGDQAFKFLGSAAFSGVDGQLRLSGGILQGDVNGDKVADFQIKIVGTLTGGDIVL